VTPKERWLALFRGGAPDHPPCDYWGTAEVTAQLLRDLQCATERDLWRALAIDKCIFLAARHPRAAEDTWHTPSLFSVWGVETRLVPYLDGRGCYEEAVNPPLAAAETAADIERHAWPRAEDWDCSRLAAECAAWSKYPIVGAAYEPFYLYSRLRGMERALADLVEAPALVEAAMERIFAIHADITTRSIDAAPDGFDFVYVAEDLGTQTSLLMSPAAFRRHLQPWLRRMVDLAHARGKLVFHHDDGAIRPLIGDLIDCGIDLLNPIQWRSRGMEREGLARDFGATLVFHGGVDNQQTLPFGTPADVRREVRENLRLFAAGKGYVAAPCHNVQVGTPTANIMALYEAIGG
jgi:uroporphyrinogen decarboxylase